MKESTECPIVLLRFYATCALAQMPPVNCNSDAMMCRGVIGDFLEGVAIGLCGQIGCFD